MSRTLDSLLRRNVFTGRGVPGVRRNPNTTVVARESRQASLTAAISRRSFLAASAAAAVSLAGGFSRARAAGGKPRLSVGLLLPTEGPLVDEATSLMAGFELRLAEEGDSGCGLKLERRDTGPDEEKVLEAIATLVMKDGVRFLVGPMGLEASVQAVHGLADTPVIHFVNNASVRLVSGELCLPGSFRLCGNTYQLSRPLSPWALKNVGRKLFLTGTDDWLGNETADFFAEGFDRAGGSFTDRKMVGGSDGSMKAVIQAIADSNPDFVFASFRGSDAARFVKACREAPHTIDKPILGPEFLIEYPGTLNEMGSTGAGIRTLTSLQDPRGFAQRIKTKLGREITHVSRAAEGYDIAGIICSVSEDARSGDWDRDKMVKRIAAMEIKGPRGTVRFDANHNLVLPEMVQEWEQKQGAWNRKILARLGDCASPDFGCGKVGFPRKPERSEDDEKSTSQ